MKKYNMFFLLAFIVTLSACGKSDGNAPSALNVLKGSTSKTATTAFNTQKLNRMFAEFGNYLMPSAVATAWTTGYRHGGNVSSFKATIYKIYFTTDAGCSVGNSATRVLVKDFGAGQAFDLSQSPTISDLSAVPAGTYKCIIFEMSDTWSIVADATAQQLFQGCSDGLEHSWDNCIAGAGNNFQCGSDLDGNTVHGTNGVDHLFMMYSTSTVTSSTGKTVSGLLSNAITLPASSPITFYADATAVAGAGGTYGDGQSGVTDWNYEYATHNGITNTGTTGVGANAQTGYLVLDGKAACLVDTPALGLR